MILAHVLLVGVDGVHSSQHGHHGQVAQGAVQLRGGEEGGLGEGRMFERTCC